MDHREALLRQEIAHGVVRQLLGEDDLPLVEQRSLVGDLERIDRDERELSVAFIGRPEKVEKLPVGPVELDQRASRRLRRGPRPSSHFDEIDAEPRCIAPDGIRGLLIPVLENVDDKDVAPREILVHDPFSREPYLFLFPHEKRARVPVDGEVTRHVQNPVHECFQALGPARDDPARGEGLFQDRSDVRRYPVVHVENHAYPGIQLDDRDLGGVNGNAAASGHGHEVGPLVFLPAAHLG